MNGKFTFACPCRRIWQQPTWRAANNFHPDVESAPSRSTSHWKLNGGRIVTTLSGTLLLEVVSPHSP
jgi:hypothetical protein